VTEEAEVDLDSADLGELAVMANKFHDEVQAAGNSMLVAAWNAGQTLLTAKELCGHGEWLPWLEANFHGSQRTARRYVTCAAFAATQACSAICSACTRMRHPQVRHHSQRCKTRKLMSSECALYRFSNFWHAVAALLRLPFGWYEGGSGFFVIASSAALMDSVESKSTKSATHDRFEARVRRTGPSASLS
jgi:hypothetical protein